MRNLLIFVAFCSLMAGCASSPTGSGPDDHGIIPASVIHGNLINLSADIDHATLAHPIKITMSCMPLVTGKGVIGLVGAKRDGSFEWNLLTPSTDTVTLFQDYFYSVYIPVEFTTNQNFVQEWSVQLLQRTGTSGGSYYFNAHAHVDSIFIADSNRMYSIASAVAQKYCPVSLGWDPDAGGDGYYLNP